MQRINLTLDYGTKEVFNSNRKTVMSFNGGWLRDHYFRSVCLHVGYSRRLRDDKNPHPGTNNAQKSIVNGQKGKINFPSLANIKRLVFRLVFSTSGFRRGIFDEFSYIRMGWGVISSCRRWLLRRQRQLCGVCVPG